MFICFTCVKCACFVFFSTSARFDLVPKIPDVTLCSLLGYISLQSINKYNLISTLIPAVYTWYSALLFSRQHWSGGGGQECLQLEATVNHHDSQFRRLANTHGPKHVGQTSDGPIVLVSVDFGLPTSVHVQRTCTG